MRKNLLVLAIGAMLLGACNAYSLRYAAMPQPSGTPLFADYVRLEGSVAVEIDTNHHVLEDAYIRKADGTTVHAQSISLPQPGSPPLSTSIGGGFGVQHDATNNVAYGTGLAVPPSPERYDALTRAVFSAADMGPTPWELHVKVQGVPEAIFPGVGGPPTTK